MNGRIAALICGGAFAYGCLLAALSSARAQDTPTMTGQLTRPIAWQDVIIESCAVVVTVDQDCPNVIDLALTDNDGRFTIQIAEAGVVRAIGGLGRFEEAFLVGAGQ